MAETSTALFLLLPTSLEDKKVGAGAEEEQHKISQTAIS
jgi:hypothetical protein